MQIKLNNRFLVSIIGFCCFVVMQKLASSEKENKFILTVKKPSQPRLLQWVLGTDDVFKFQGTHAAFEAMYPGDEGYKKIKLKNIEDNIKEIALMYDKEQKPSFWKIMLGRFNKQDIYKAFVPDAMRIPDKIEYVEEVIKKELFDTYNKRKLEIKEEMNNIETIEVILPLDELLPYHNKKSWSLFSAGILLASLGSFCFHWYKNQLSWQTVVGAIGGLIGGGMGCWYHSPQAGVLGLTCLGGVTYASGIDRKIVSLLTGGIVSFAFAYPTQKKKDPYKPLDLKTGKLDTLISRGLGKTKTQLLPDDGYFGGCNTWKPIVAPLVVGLAGGLLCKFLPWLLSQDSSVQGSSEQLETLFNNPIANTYNTLGKDSVALSFSYPGMALGGLMVGATCMLIINMIAYNKMKNKYIDTLKETCFSTGSQNALVKDGDPDCLRD